MRRSSQRAGAGQPGRQLEGGRWASGLRGSAAPRVQPSIVPLIVASASGRPAGTVTTEASVAAPARVAQASQSRGPPSGVAAAPSASSAASSGVTTTALVRSGAPGGFTDSQNVLVPPPEPNADTRWFYSEASQTQWIDAMELDQLTPDMPRLLKVGTPHPLASPSGWRWLTLATAPSHSNESPLLSHPQEMGANYDPDMLAAALSERWPQVTGRAVTVSTSLGGFIAAVAADYATGRFESNMPNRAKELRTLMGRLGCAGVRGSGGPQALGLT
jgi:hypothetical protein